MNADWSKPQTQRSKDSAKFENGNAVLYAY